MDPPSYDEANRQHSAVDTQVYHIRPPPPSYDASHALNPSPPPTYREAVREQPGPFPVLTLPTVPAPVTSPTQNSGIIIHPTTEIGTEQPGRRRRVSVGDLREKPDFVRCPYCQHVVKTNLGYSPGSKAWGLCILLTVMGFVCGCCIIPLTVAGLQNVHHYCSHCRRRLHTYKR